MRYVVCKTMGWDFYTYERQPVFFLEEIFVFLKQESEAQEAEMKSLEALQRPKPKGYSRTR